MFNTLKITMYKNIIASTNIGLVRSINEDNYLIDNQDFSNIFESNNYKAKQLIVFDGIGGLDFGEVASKEARNYLEKELKANNVVDALVNTNTQLLKVLDNLNVDSFGTTVAGIKFNKNKIEVFNMGDSRVYRFRRGILVKLSKDHTFQNNVITSYLSKSNLNQINDIHYEVNEVGSLLNDIFLLTTDGVTDLITDEELSDILSSSDTLLEKHDLICDLVLTRGAHDNFTLIVYEVKEIE